ncbi:MAG TPA: 23S rRNA (pseudouridine(1915)-N(3))-methyltransferase RlmH [Ruminococcaceae bacterium]|nr:23S rRNA (pseudouridine(1915)-N(3))-methyltransferase RlmH [Oscillospiraceae bacterium]
MMNIRLVCVGKMKEPFYRDAAREYEKRLTKLCRIETIELPETRLPETPSPAQVEKALYEEGQAALKKLEGFALRAALCVEGTQASSEEFAGTFRGEALLGSQSAAFVIGGSFGLSEEVKKACNKNISFSRMTFPHHLMRVILLEQIYRAFQIITGGKYHK